MSPKSYIDINRESWNKRLDAHLSSEFYDLESFMAGQTSLNPIELELLGNVSGLSILHLQCHFGQDSISLSRMGAQVTGVDLADKAIAEANELAREAGTTTQFICCDIYDLPQYCTQQFDIVYTSYGTIGWLPDLDKWAQIISEFLKPKGKLVFVEFHPVVWMFDDDFTHIQYAYFNTQPIAEVQTGTYAAKDADLELEYITWNHDLAEVIGSLISHNLSIKSFKEYDYSPYDCFNNTVEDAPSVYRINGLERKIPMVYAIVAQKSN